MSDHLREPLTNRALQDSTQLLVSVRSADEAAVALAAGVDWIDLKNPDAGPLGCPELPIAESVARVVGDSPKTSAALGELPALDLQVTTSLAGLFPVLKVGLSNCLDADVDWVGRLREVSDRIAPKAQLVPVIYADYNLCNAPCPSDVIDAAAQLGFHWLLIDTFTKQGLNLLDFFAVDELASLNQQALSASAQLVFAGSLTLACAKQLLRLRPTVLAVRGAVCENGRQSAISPSKIADWLKMLRSQPTKITCPLGEPPG